MRKDLAEIQKKQKAVRLAEQMSSAFEDPHDIEVYMNRLEHDYVDPQEMLKILARDDDIGITDAKSGSVENPYIADVLSRIMSEKGWNDKELYPTILSNRIVATQNGITLDKDESMRKDLFPNIRKDPIERYFTGKTRSPERSRVIEMCFALSLDIKQSTALLYALGHPGFNLRNAHDAVYFYSLLNDLTLKDADGLWKRFCDAVATDRGIIITTPPTDIKTAVNTVQLIGYVDASEETFGTRNFTEDLLKLRIYLDDIYMDSIKLSNQKIDGVKRPYGFRKKLSFSFPSLKDDPFQEHILSVIITDENGNCMMSASRKLIYYQPSGNTTRMYADPANEFWKSEKDFITNLIERRQDYFDYSTNAILEFYKLKNELFAYLIYSNIVHHRNWSLPEIMEFTVESYSRSLMKLVKNMEVMKEFPFLKEAYDNAVNTGSRNTEKDVILYIVKNYNDSNDLEVQKALYDFYTAFDNLNEKKIIERYLDSLNRNPDPGPEDNSGSLAKNKDEYKYKDSNDHRRKSTGSSLKETVLKQFVAKTEKMRPEQNPWYSFSTDFRKDVIYFYYLLNSIKMVDAHYMKPKMENEMLDGTASFVSVMDGLQKVLLRCGMASIDPRIKFDLLICKAFYLLSDALKKNDDDLIHDAVVYVNAVIRYSYDEYYGIDIE